MGDGGTPDGFEWDSVKAATNREKHGVPFEFAAAAFLDERRLDQSDDRYDYGEDRRTVIASIEEELYTIVYVMWGRLPDHLRPSGQPQGEGSLWPPLDLFWIRITRRGSQMTSGLVSTL